MKKLFVGLLILCCVQFLTIACFAGDGDPVLEGKMATGNIMTTGQLGVGDVPACAHGMARQLKCLFFRCTSLKQCAYQKHITKKPPSQVAFLKGVGLHLYAIAVLHESLSAEIIKENTVGLYA